MKKVSFSSVSEKASHAQTVDGNEKRLVGLQKCGLTIVWKCFGSYFAIFVLFLQYHVPITHIVIKRL